MRGWMQWTSGVSLVVGAMTTIGCGAEPPNALPVITPTPEVVQKRATISGGFDINIRTVIVRASGDREDQGDDELYLAFENRAVFNVTVHNRSDGWAPVNFELCIDHPNALAVIDPENEYFESNPPLEDPCVVRYDDGRWPIVHQGKDEEYVAGAVEAKDAGGGYVTIYFRVEFEKAGALDLYEYTVPYRVLPHQ